MTATPRPLSFARLALLSVTAGSAVLIVGVAIVLVLAMFSPLAALVVAFAVIAGSIAAMGFTSNRLVNNAIAVDATSTPAGNDRAGDGSYGNDKE